jgi:broad specificity phosphatase PhoE
MTYPAFHGLSGAADFFLIRHGESAANTRKEMQGCRVDTPLSENGRRQAEALGRWLEKRGPLKVFSSPLLRAHETAEIICRITGNGKPEVLQDLIEFDVGMFGGLTLEEIEKQYPDHWKEFRRQSWEAVPEAEKISTLTERASLVWERIIGEANTAVAKGTGSGKILCVTHGGFIQWLIKATLSECPQVWMPVFKVSNCGVFHLHVEPTSTDSGPGYYGMWNRMNYTVE